MSPYPMLRLKAVTGLRLLLAIVLVTAFTGTAETLYYTNLAARLTDLERLAMIPEPGNTAKQWSSYARNSYYDTNSGLYMDWTANNDCCDFIRLEGDKQVLAEMQGPGCIWRIWSATPGTGHVRIYLDGSSTPAVDLPFQEYFTGQHVPFNRSALVHTTTANGWNNYTPIPYNKSCKIVADSDWGLYYHINYETFPAGTIVPTFTTNLSTADNAALDRANAQLLNAGTDPAGSRLGATSVTNVFVCNAGSTQLVATVDGPRAITGLKVKLNPEPEASDYDTLRQLVLQITWDGQTNAAIWCPLGDFFGTAPGPNVYKSLPLGHTSDGWWYCYWYMPFAASAKIELVNEGSFNKQATFEITCAPLSKPVGELARFHVKWHRNSLLPTEPERWIDWTVLKTEGAGRFVGMMLHVWNPRGGWWGEGDEKFFVDGEKFPSTFGTGSEDYFGYAWSSGTMFQHPYHNQTHNDGDSRGQLSVNRWHLGDDVPFHTSYEAYIEKYFPDARPTLYAGTAYWYLTPAGTDPYGTIPANERVGYWTPLEVYAVPGALEGEKLQIIGSSGGNTQTQDMGGFPDDKWSNEAHLWWTGAQPGNWLDLGIPVTNAANYKLAVQLTKARDYGIVQLYLDGQALGQPIDLYDLKVITTGALDFGMFYLTSGTHILRVQITGANPSAIPAYMAALDYVKLEPALTVVDALNLRYPFNELAVVFSKAVNPATATNARNYSLNNGATVSWARMGTNPDTVVLRTSPLLQSATNVVTVNNVTDRAAFPNTLPANSTVTVERKLNTWLRLDETGGSTAADSSGNSHDGTYSGGSLSSQSGKMLGAFAFDGVDDHVELPSGYADFTFGLTVSAWVQTTAVDNWARIIDFGNGNNSDNILLARNGTSDRITFEVYKGGVTGGKATTPTGSLKLNQWQHVAATLQPSGVATVYIDGLPAGTGAVAIPEIVLRGKNYIGKSNWSVDDYFTGKLDDIRIYNRALGPEAIKALAQEITSSTPSLAVTLKSGDPVIYYEGRLIGAESLNGTAWQTVATTPGTPYVRPPGSPLKFFRSVTP